MNAMNKKRVRLADTSDWFASTNGIIQTLTDNFNVPWKVLIPDATDLDLDYYSRSGGKYVSPLVSRLSNDEGEISTENMLRLATVIYNRYSLGWNRLWSALNLEYNPLHNYDGTETFTEVDENEVSKESSSTVISDGTNTGTVGLSESNTGTVQNSGSDTGTVRVVSNNTGTVTTDTENTGTVGTQNTNNSTTAGTNANTGTVQNAGTSDADVYGFNSSSAVHDNKTTVNGTQTNNLTTTTNETVTGSSSSTVTNNLDTETTVTNNLENDSTQTNNLSNSNTRTDNLSHSSTTTNNLSSSTDTEGSLEESSTQTRNHTYTLEKGGNLGITTSQQMLESEVLFRAKYNFFESLLFPNLDSVLTLAIY